MGASDQAIPLSEENPKWIKNLKYSKVVCPGGYKGPGHELLCEDDNDTHYCPQCK